MPRYYRRRYYYGRQRFYKRRIPKDISYQKVETVLTCSFSAQQGDIGWDTGNQQNPRVNSITLSNLITLSNRGELFGKLPVK